MAWRAADVLSADLVALVASRAEALPRLPAVEDALVGTLLEGVAKPLDRPANFRHKNRDDYAVTVCEADTEFVLLHKLSVEDLWRCRQATQRRRSERCPRGPCTCRSLGHRFSRPRKLVRTFEQAAQMHGHTSDGKTRNMDMVVDVLHREFPGSRGHHDSGAFVRSYT
jgi:hypothetical protein